MNLLHLFMLLIFIIGILLIILTFIVYSKLKDSCNSKDLKTKLRLAIGLGTTFIVITISYMMCITNSNCKCDFGENTNWKFYIMLLLLISMGSGLLILTIGINNDLKTNNCNVDLGIIPNLLIGLSISQIVISFIYIIYSLKYKDTKGDDDKDTKDDDNKDDDKDTKDDDNIALEAKSRTDAVNSVRISRYNKNISVANEQLSNLYNKLESGPIKTNDRNKYKEEIKELTDKISKYKQDLGSIKSGSSSDSDLSSRVPSSFVGI